MVLYLIADDNLYADTGFFWPSSVTLFGETVSFCDFVSTILLLACSGLSFLIYFRRQKKNASGAMIWAVMSFGLFVLSQDEFFSFHEQFDVWVHEISGMRQTAVPSQIDTFVLATYAIVAAYLLWGSRREIHECASTSWKAFLVPGFMIAIISMICDGLTDSESILNAWWGHRRRGVHRAFIEIENLCELLAEALFVAFFGMVLWNVTAKKHELIE